MLNISNFFVTLAEDQTTTENVGMDLIRLIFGVLSRYVYDFIAKITDIFYDIALVLNVNGEGISKLANSITDKLFVVILIYMIFRGTITMLSYLVDPESFQDKAKGGATFIKKVLISIVLLISINPIFNLLGTIQADIIDSDIVTNLFNGNKTNTVFETDGGQTIYFMSMSPRCDDGYLVATFSKGEHLSLETLKPFIQPYGQTDMANLIGEPVYYCGADMTDLFNGNYNDFKYIDSDPDSTYQTMSGILSPRTSAMDYLGPSVYNSTNGTWPDQHEYNIDFNFFFCLVVGIVILLVLISFTFDVVIRAFNLVVLKVLAPVPIIAYMSPKGKDAEMLGIWIKKVISTWASLFIRLIALEFALAIISIICDGGVLPDNSFGFIESLFVIFGALMFAKKLPQLLEEIIPGFKLSGGFELNPFKRISNDALGGKAALGLAAGAGALALGAATNFAQRSAEGVQAMSKATNSREALRAVFGGAARTVGSTIAGGTRAGVNAFNRTRKDGNMFGGLWNGYQTSMYSKLKRDEYRAQGGTGFGALAADFHRFTGTLTAGQREYKRADELNSEIAGYQAQIDANKLVVEREKNNLKPHELFKSEASAIKSRLSDLYDKDSNVQAARARKEGFLKSLADVDKEIETAEAARKAYLGDDILEKARLDKAISDAKNKKTNAASNIKRLQDAIDAAEKEVARSKYATDETLQAHLKNITALKSEFRTELSGYSDVFTSDGEYHSDVVRSIDNHIATENARIAHYERENIQSYQDKISDIKNSEEYKRVTNDKSANKIANSRTFNKETQAPGTQWHGSVEGGVVEGVPMPGYLDSNGDGRLGGGTIRREFRSGGGTPPPPGPPPGGAPH